MPLTMRLDQTPDMGGKYRYVVRSGGMLVGMLEQLAGGPSKGWWRYGLTLSGPPDFVGNGIAETLEHAKDRLHEAWQRWLQWAELQEISAAAAKPPTINGYTLTEEDLERLRQQIEALDYVDVISDEVRELIAERWPHLLAKLKPLQEQ